MTTVMPMRTSIEKMGKTSESTPGIPGNASLVGGAGTTTCSCGGAIQMRGGRLKAWRVAAGDMLPVPCCWSSRRSPAFCAVCCCFAAISSHSPLFEPVLKQPFDRRERAISAESPESGRLEGPDNPQRGQPEQHGLRTDQIAFGQPCQQGVTLIIEQVALHILQEESGRHEQFGGKGVGLNLRRAARLPRAARLGCGNGAEVAVDMKCAQVMQLQVAQFVGDGETLARLRVRHIHPDNDLPLLFKEQTGKFAVKGDVANARAAQLRNLLNRHRRLPDADKLE